MTPEDQAPPNPVSPAGNNPEPSRPTPWVPSQDKALGGAAVTDTQATETATGGNGFDDAPDTLPSSSPDSDVLANSDAAPSAQSQQPPQSVEMPSSFVPPAEPTPPLGVQPAPQEPFGEPQSPATGPDMAAGPQPPLMPPSPAKGKAAKLVLLVVIVLVLGIGGYFGYKAFKNHSQNASVKNAVNNAASNSKAANATDLGTLNNMKFVASASAVEGLTKVDIASNPNASEYTTADQSCALTFGTATAAIDPGNSITDVVNDTLQQAKNKGAIASTPAAVQARTFKDTANSSKVYSMPTFQYEYSVSGEYATGVQSVDILKNGLRAIVAVACSMKGSSPTAAMLAPLEQVAGQLTVTAE